MLVKFVYNLALFGVLGLSTGLAVSVFFKNKHFVRNYISGMGIGYAFHYNFGGLMCCKK